MLYSIQAGKRKSMSSLVGLFVQQRPQLIGQGVSFVKIRLKKSRDLINLCTFEACESIQIAAERKGDSSMLHILNGVNGDLIAAEAKYHKNCFATYVSKKTTLSLPKGEALDSPHERAFQDLVFDLAAGIEQGRAYDMMSLLSKYQEIITQKGADSPESYTSQNLKIRLQKHFSTLIVFHQPADRSKSELSMQVPLTWIFSNN